MITANGMPSSVPTRASCAGFSPEAKRHPRPQRLQTSKAQPSTLLPSYLEICVEALPRRSLSFSSASTAAMRFDTSFDGGAVPRLISCSTPFEGNPKLAQESAQEDFQSAVPEH